MKPDILFFRQAVYDVVRAIPPGRVLSYGVVASLAGWPNHARQVGHVLAHVPQSLNLPCHRVVGSDGRLSSVFAAQHELLAREHVAFRPNGKVDMCHFVWQYDQSL